MQQATEQHGCSDAAGCLQSLTRLPVRCNVHSHVQRTPSLDDCMQVKKNLHIVLSFSPVGSAFRERLTKFPALVNCTTIDWFSAWPRNALHSVASTFLADLSGVEAKVGL